MGACMPPIDFVSLFPPFSHFLRQHPNFYAYFPANATFEGLLGDLHSAAITNPGESLSQA